MHKIIKEQFDKVIAYSQEALPEPKTDELFDKWLKRKDRIIKAFGNKLIYEIDNVSFEITEEAKKQRITGFINHLWDNGYEKLGRFLDAQRNGFFKNAVVSEYIVTNDTKTSIIKKGSKLVKAFKYFVENEMELNELQIKASQIIQEDKITGTLCFSVHPLDYLSVSENTYNWRSCHALDGEYRAGNLSYMMDNCTIVCYLRGEKDTRLPNFPDSVLWNSKKWRVLLYLSNDWNMIFAGKQYPFSSESGMQLVLDWLNKNFIKDPFNEWYTPSNDEECCWTNWTDFTLPKIEHNGINFDFYDNFIPLGGTIKPLEGLVVDADGSKHFNDVLKSSCYNPIYTYLTYKNWNNSIIPYASRSTQFEIGAKTYCLRCGKEEVLESASTMMCYDCELNYGTSENADFGFCADCGRRIAVEDGRYIEDDLYCDSCFREVGAQCDDCGDYFLKDDMYYDETIDEYICEWCRKSN